MKPTPIEPPLTVNHETLRLYDALKQTLELNETLQKKLLEAAKTIEKLTEALNGRSDS